MNRLLPVVATHNLVTYTKILYSKTIFGKKIEVKIQAQCQLIVSVGPSRHDLYCYAKVYYKIFSVNKVKNLYSFKKQVFTNWSWGKSWGGNWNVNFGIGFPPPFSFISLNLHASVTYNIWVNLNGKIIKFWYPTIYQAKADIGTKIRTFASATLKVLAIKGGVYIDANPLVQVKTDPTVTLYYYWLQQHGFIVIWVKWYWEITAFKITWGFRYKTWFFGWSGWKNIKKWSINGFYGKWKIVNKWFVRNL